MAKKTPPFKDYPKWTEAKFWAFLRSALRAKWSRWPPRYEILQSQRRAYKGPKKQQKYEYKCSRCNKWWMQKEVEVDHIIPCGSLNKYEDLPEFVRKLFTSTDNLRIVCKPCHKIITKENKDGFN